MKDHIWFQLRGY